MRAVLIGIVTALVCIGSAVAAPWVAQMEEDEGGDILVASVIAPSEGDFPPMVRITCGTEIAVRYDPAPPQGSVELGATAELEFATGDATVSRAFGFEEYDGFFGAYMPGGDPLLALLMAGNEVTITDLGGALPTRVFTLEGSRTAIGRVLAACGP